MSLRTCPWPSSDIAHVYTLLPHPHTRSSNRLLFLLYVLFLFFIFIVIFNSI